jgi:hypothetical protein
VSDAEQFERLVEALRLLKANKPADRSEKARAYAIVITEMEKTVAYFKLWIIQGAEL